MQKCSIFFTVLLMLVDLVENFLPRSYRYKKAECFSCVTTCSFNLNRKLSIVFSNTFPKFVESNVFVLSEHHKEYQKYRINDFVVVDRTIYYHVLKAKASGD